MKTQLEQIADLAASWLNEVQSGDMPQQWNFALASCANKVEAVLNSPPEWLSELPTEPGWYWICYKGWTTAAAREVVAHPRLGLPNLMVLHRSQFIPLESYSGYQWMRAQVPALPPA